MRLIPLLRAARATDQMGSYKPADHAVDESVAPLVQFFELVHIGDTILQMVQVYYDREMVRQHIFTTSHKNYSR